MVVLPWLPRISLHAGRCLGSTHAQRLARALEAMQRHPAYARNAGHDHVLLFNYWDAWGVFGARGSPSHAALANLSLGWHETQDAAWGMANHRHVGRCQVALPYVEVRECARLAPAVLASWRRPTPVYFAGAAADFDTDAAAGRCPNVARHAAAVRTALFTLGGATAGNARSSPAAAPPHAAPSDATGHAPPSAAPSLLTGAWLEKMPHNLRTCHGSASCEGRAKVAAAAHYAHSRLCPVAAGDTPSTGRLYDAIACGCVPLIVVDDLQLPFPRASGAPSAAPLAAASTANHSPGLVQRSVRGVHWTAYGVVLPEATLLANATDVVASILTAAEWPAVKSAVLHTREQLTYRRRRSLVGTYAMRELWTSCVQSHRSHARPLAAVARC